MEIFPLELDAEELAALDAESRHRGISPEELVSRIVDERFGLTPPAEADGSRSDV